MKYKVCALLTLLIAVIFVPSDAAYAHAGRTDSTGCHNVRATGGRHCHNARSGLGNFSFGKSKRKKAKKRRR